MTTESSPTCLANMVFVKCFICENRKKPSFNHRLNVAGKKQNLLQFLKTAKITREGTRCG